MKNERRSALFRGLTVAAVVIGALVAPGTPVAAQSDPSAGGAAAGSNITLDVKDRPLKDVVEFVRGKTAVNIIVSPDAEQQKVTINIRDLPWEKALELIAENAECVLVRDGANLLKVEKPPQVSFEFEDADIRKVISVIAAYSGANIVVGQEVQGTVTIRLNKVPWRSALDTVVKTLGFVVVEDERQILRVTDPARLQEQLETRVYTFKFVRPPAPYQAKIKTDVQVDSVKAPNVDVEKEFNILKAFRAAVAPEGSLEYIQASNSVVVTGTKPKLDQLEQLIYQVDIEPSMVGVDIKFVLTRNRDFLDVGVDPGDEGFKVSMDFGKMTHRLPFSLGDGGWEDSISAEGSGPPEGDWHGTGPVPVASGTGFTFGTLDFTGVQFALRLLKQDVASRLVQAPKVLTLDNQAATIFVGETIRYAQTSAEQGQAGGLQYSIEEAANSPVQTGFQMLVIPHVIPDSQKVMLTVIPQQKTLTGTSAEQPGFNVFRGGTGASEVQIALPQEAAATVVTHMLLESGETAVIGGLLTDAESKQVNKIPFVGDLPIIGWLFKNERTSETKDHLIILITPQILRGAEERRASLSQEIQQVQERLKDEYKEIIRQETEAPAPADSSDE
jgi:type II secretory pathway component GspD/PulD (secretin)